MKAIENQLISLLSSRKQAYSFIIDKIKRLITSACYRLTKTAGDDNNISLSDLGDIQYSTSDQTLELIITHRHLLRTFITR